MKRELLLGLDFGTSSLKAVIFDREGNAIASASKKYGIYRDGSCVEQDPEDYYIALRECIADMREQSSEYVDDIVGIGLTGQTPTDIFLDKDGKPLMRGISWQDTRAVAEADKMKARFSSEKMRELVGNNVPITASWSASRYLWFMDNCKELAKKLAHVSITKDYVGFRLTGGYMSDAWNMRSSMHLTKERVSDELLEFLGMDHSYFPEIGPLHAIRGGLTETAAKELGLKAGIPVSNGCGDALATMLGSGVLMRKGIGFDSSGTSEIVGISIEGEYSNAGDGLMLIPANVTGALSMAYGPTQSGSGSLVWLARNITHSESIDAAFEEASKIPAGCEGMMFVAYLSGERAPIWQPNVRGSFSGVDMIHSSAHMARAVMEGVAFSVKHCLHLAESGSGIAPEAIRITGGGSRTPLWMQIKADICGAPVETLVCDNACALGAAMTAGVGIGMFRDYVDASETMVRVKDRIMPNPDNRELYEKLFRRYLFESETAIKRLSI